MTRNLIHAGWLALLVALSMLSARDGAASELPRAKARPAARGSVSARSAPIADAQGILFEPRAYRRIVSTSSVADGIALALLERDRILALSRWGAEHSAEPQRYAGLALVGSPTDIESMRALAPELVLANYIGPEAPLARLREVGVPIFNLGEMRGLATLLPNIDAVATLIGAPERGERLKAQLVRRMAAVAAAVPVHARKGAVYASVYGSAIYGGTRGTSYADVLRAAGLLDVAAQHFENWPHYDPEQLLTMDPELIVTHAGMGAALCAIHGLARLRACTPGRGRTIEVDGELIGDPGLRMLEAAEQLHDLVYGAP